jgi:hypothetical protein
MSRLGSNYHAYARVPICRACGNPFVPPGYDGCCSVRCVQYLEVARQPVLGDPIFCQRDEPVKCWGCEVSFMSRGVRFCPECYFKARPGSAEAVGVGVGTGLAPVRTYGPIKDRNPRSRCHW